MSRCSCIECRIKDARGYMDQETMRLMLAMTALSRVMYWVWVSLASSWTMFPMAHMGRLIGADLMVGCTSPIELKYK